MSSLFVKAILSGVEDLLKSIIFFPLGGVLLLFTFDFSPDLGIALYNLESAEVFLFPNILVFLFSYEDD